MMLATMSTASALREVLVRQPAVERLGWTLVHSLWQGVIVAGAAAAMLRAMRSAPAATRYAAACGALVVMLLAGLATYCVIPATTPPSPPQQPVRLPVPLEISPSALPVAPFRPIVAEPPIAPRQVIILACLTATWAAGVIIVATWHVGGWLLLLRMRHGRPLDDLRPVLDRLMRRMNVTAPVRLIETLHVDVPAVIGVLRPVILLPAALLSGITPQQLEAILAHELAHVRRHDYLVNLLQAAAETLLFYHPAAWWISAQVRREREHCCDDVAAAVCGDRRAYAAALAALEERRPAVGRLATAATGGELSARIRRLLQLPPAAAPPKPRAGRARSLGVALLAFGCVIIPLGLSVQQRTSKAADAKPAASKPADLDNLSPITPEDLKPVVADYRISPNDLVQVSISDLVGPGVETVKSVRVSESGIISLPLVGEMKAAGLTAPEAEKAVAKAYREKNLIANAQVSVSVTEARGRTFSILGPVDRPGQYQIMQADFRVLDALAQAGGRPELIDKLRVVRKEKDAPARVLDIPLDKLTAGDTSVNVVIRPGDTLVGTPRRQNFATLKVVIGKETLLCDGKAVDMDALKKRLDAMPEAERRNTVLEVAAASPDVTVARFFSISAQLSALVNHYHLAYLSQTGIQPTTGPTGARGEDGGGDVGEYYISGYVARVGVYSLTGRKISLKQAIIAAGGLDRITRANITVIRREGDQEKTAVKDVPLDDLMSGRAQEIYLRPNDIVQVQPAPPLPGDPKNWSPEQIAKVDPTINEQIRALKNADENLALLKRKFGPGNPEVKDVEAGVELLKARVTARAAEFRSTYGSAAAATQP